MAKSTEAQRQDWQHKKTRAWKVFRTVMDYYYECKANLAACQPVDYDGNVGSHGFVIGKVIILPSDFTSDESLMAKKILDEAQYKHFKAKYLDQEFHTQTTIESIDVTVQELLGNHFFRVGLYPPHKYMKTVRKF